MGRKTLAQRLYPKTAAEIAVDRHIELRRVGYIGGGKVSVLVQESCKLVEKDPNQLKLFSNV